MLKRLRPLLLLTCVLLPAAPAVAADTCCRCTAPGESEVACVTHSYSARAVTPEAACLNLPTSGGLPGWNCVHLPPAQCKPVGTGAGVCQRGPLSSFELKKQREEGGEIPIIGAQENTRTPAIIPRLNTPIPGFSFTGADEVTHDTSSLLARYLAAVYRYGISITAVAATVMFVFGAFQYLVGSAIPTIQRGKTIMQEAILGMILVFGANMILRTVNPDTLSLEALYIEAVSPLEVGQYNEFIRTRGDIPPGLIPSTPKEQVAREIIEGVKLATGVDPCVILAICEHESGLQPLWNGIQSGTPKNEAIAFGPCQAVTSFLHDSNPTARRAAATFPGFPLLSKSALAQGGNITVGDWLLENPRGAGFIAALTFRANQRLFNGNEITALGGYGAGAKSIQNWQEAHKCVPASGGRIRDATDSTAIQDACLPHSVGIPNKAEGQGCPEDGWECANPKSDSKARLVGTCSNGKQCYAMITDTFAEYVISAYPRLVRTYQCDR